MALKTPNSRVSKRNPESGLTLIELLIAVALLGIVLLGIAPLFIASMKSNYSGNEYTSINNLARDRLEQLMSLPVSDRQLSANVGTYQDDMPLRLPDPTTGLPTATSPINPFMRTYEIRNFRSDPPLVAGGPYQLVDVSGIGVPYDFKRIDVTVTSVRDRTVPGGLPSLMGFGQRTARVSGFIKNPDPVSNTDFVP